MVNALVREIHMMKDYEKFKILSAQNTVSAQPVTNSAIAQLPWFKTVMLGDSEENRLRSITWLKT
jgi:hypothetical protein